MTLYGGCFWSSWSSLVLRSGVVVVVPLIDSSSVTPPGRSARQGRQPLVIDVGLAGRPAEADQGNVVELRVVAGVCDYGVHNPCPQLASAQRFHRLGRGRDRAADALFGEPLAAGRLGVLDAVGV